MLSIADFWHGKLGASREYRAQTRPGFAPAIPLSLPPTVNAEHSLFAWKKCHLVLALALLWGGGWARWPSKVPSNQHSSDSVYMFSWLPVVIQLPISKEVSSWNWLSSDCWCNHDFCLFCCSYSCVCSWRNFGNWGLCDCLTYVLNLWV